MKQQCYMAMIYCSWAVYLGGLVFLGYRSQWAFAAGWLIAAPLIEWLYIRKFPSLSPLMGYGAIADESAPVSAPPASAAEVTLYTALGCPFCPLVEERLEQLRQQMDFPFERIDVTLRPDLLASKGIRSVPVVEVGGKLLFGLVTTKELAEAIAQTTAHPARM